MLHALAAQHDYNVPAAVDFHTAGQTRSCSDSDACLDANVEGWLGLQQLMSVLPA